MSHIKELMSRSPEETFSLGVEMGRSAVRGTVIALSGELGTGKTILAKGIAAGMGITEEITSPTFTLLEIYEHTLPFYHFDLYRIEGDQEMDNLFFEEYWEGDGVSVIEWAERAGDRLPENTIRIRLAYADSTGRRITVEYPGD